MKYISTARLAVVPLLLTAAGLLGCVPSPTSLPTHDPPPQPIPFVNGTAQVTPSATAIETSTPLQPIKTIWPSKTPVRVYPTPTATPNGEVEWNEDLEIHPIISDYDFIRAAWSPKLDELFLFMEWGFSNTLMRFAAPDFYAQEVMTTSPVFAQTTPEPMIGPSCIAPDLIWTSDGRQVYFSGPISSGQKKFSSDPCSLWVVDRLGLSARLFQPEQTERDLMQIGWMDARTLLFSGWRSGISVLDISSGSIENWAYPDLYGTSFFAKDYFVSSHNVGHPLMFALGHQSDLTEKNFLYGENNMKYVVTPPPFTTTEKSGQFLYTASLAYDVLPNTNQVLGYVFQESNLPTDAAPATPIRTQKLVLWDIDQNKTTSIVPYGIWGAFSPDQHTLAYVTEGPAVLDNNYRPVDSNPAHQDQRVKAESGDYYYWEPTNTSRTYVQLLDLKTGQVFLSVPVISQNGENAPDYLGVGASFSPDGRYFTFIAHQKVLFDSNGWPASSQSLVTDSTGMLYRYVLNMDNRQLVWKDEQPDRISWINSVKQQLPKWSPTHAQFIQFDGARNLFLVDIENETTTAITTKISGFPRVDWSPSGNYILVFIPDSEFSANIAFVTIP